MCFRATGVSYNGVHMYKTLFHLTLVLLLCTTVVLPRDLIDNKPCKYSLAGIHSTVFLYSIKIQGSHKEFDIASAKLSHSHRYIKRYPTSEAN